MTLQVVLSATALRNRLNPVLDESLAPRVMAGQANWRGAHSNAAAAPCFNSVAPAAGPPDGSAMFGSRMNEWLRTIIVHEIDGWCSRNLADRFARRYTHVNDTENGKCRWGIGPEFYISSDGTAFRLIEMDPTPRLTYHAGYASAWAIGVETGHNNGGQGGDTDTHPPTSLWRALSRNPDLGVDDIPGLKAWVRDHNDDPMGTNDPNLREPVIGWWPTARYTGPWSQPQVGSMMLFSEEEYRTWALLARYLAEAYFIPRNFPLWPFAARGSELNSSDKFRGVVLADESYPMLVTNAGAPLAALGITEADLTGDTAAFQTAYGATVAGGNNGAWQAMIGAYRGLHAHSFSGDTSAHHDDHDCPGPMFDWHRFSREVWDYWWYPFDFNAAVTSTATPMRGYRKADHTTPLVEYYFDLVEASYTPRIVDGIHGAASSPTTFRLEQDSPVYALANGEIVAAWYPIDNAAVSLAFLLVRHEVYHEPWVIPAPVMAPFAALPPVVTDRIDYNQEPMTVYSLYMHLGNPAGVNFTDIMDANPDWLNRLLKRKKECDLGIAFHTADAAAAPHQISPAAWSSQAPGGGGRRPSLLSQWQTDAPALQAFVDALRGGNIAIAPAGIATPLRVILGDYLGPAGIIKMKDTVATYGVRVEVFSPTAPPATSFSNVAGVTAWNPPAGLPLTPALQYPSEWAHAPGPAEQAAFSAIGVDWQLVSWWQEVAWAMTWQAFAAGMVGASAPAPLPYDGNVYHLRPLDFMRWLNKTTWASEWYKYRVTDAAGNDVALPARPRSRRI
jgi:hypothetical protein